MKNSFDLVFKHIDQLVNESARKKKRSAFIIQFFPTIADNKILAPKNRESQLNLLGFCEIGDLASMNQVLSYLDGKVDFVFLDIDKKLPELRGAESQARTALKKTELFTYSDTDMWCTSLLSLISQLKPANEDSNVLLVGANRMTFQLASALQDRSYSVWIKCSKEDISITNVLESINQLRHPFEGNFVAAWSSNISTKFDIVVGAEFKSTVIGKEIISCLASEAILVDGGIGTISVDAISVARSKGLKIYRLDNRASIASTVQTGLETRDLIKNRMGREKISGVNVVAGGILGEAGDVVVDSISNPKVIIGVADGSGRMRSEPLTELELYSISKIQKLCEPIVL